MSEAFLDKMSEEEYNKYHRDLFGDEWKDINDEVKESEE